MDLLKIKKVKIRNPRKCFCCCRIFPAGAKMTYEAWAESGGIDSIYTCETCQEIISHELEYGDEVFEGFVNDLLNVGQTPEQYLATITKEEK